MQARVRGDITSSLQMGGSNVSAPVVGNNSAWHPTAVYLIVLVLAEVFFYGFMRHVFKSAHGG